MKKTWSCRNHFNMLIWCSINLYYYIYNLYFLNISSLLSMIETYLFFLWKPWLNFFFIIIVILFLVEHFKPRTSWSIEVVLIFLKTYPCQQSFFACKMVDEFKWSWRTVDTILHVAIQIQQAYSLFLASVWHLHLWAEWRDIQIKASYSMLTVCIVDYSSLKHVTWSYQVITVAEMCLLKTFIDCQCKPDDKKCLFQSI